MNNIKWKRKYTKSLGKDLEHVQVCLHLQVPGEEAPSYDNSPLWVGGRSRTGESGRIISIYKYTHI